MAKTVEEGFREFLTKLTPTTTETEKVKKHRASIKKCLESNFEMKRFFRTGSIGNGTSISGYSDTDYFAVIPTGNLKKNSKTSLKQIKEALNQRFPKTDVCVDSPSVVVPFGTLKAETTEITPADYQFTNKEEHDVFEIPDGDGGWMNSSPSAHNSYVSEVNSSLKYKVKPLVRFMKALKYYRSIPISSFYLEIRTAKYAKNESYISYSMDIKRILKYLVDNNLPRVIDPTGGGYINPCKTDNKEENALSKLKTALGRAEKAREAEKEGKIKKAFEHWNTFFYYEFPEYTGE